jgi:hypothetical protein
LQRLCRRLRLSEHGVVSVELSSSRSGPPNQAA